MSFWFFFIDTTPASVASEFGGFFIALFPSPLPPQHISLQIQWYAPRSFASSFLFFRNYLNSFTDSNLIFIFFYGFVVNWNELNLGLGEETVEPNEGDQGAEACSQHLRRWKWRSSHQSRQGFHHSSHWIRFFSFFFIFFKFKIPFLLSVLQVLEQLSGQTPVFSKG